MSDWQTASRVRLRYRRVIRAVIEAWVHGPVELLALEDKREVRAVLRRMWNRRGREKTGYRYAVWLVEVHLCLGMPGDALSGIRGKAQRKPIDRRKVMPSMLAWLDSQEKARLLEAPEQVEKFELGEFVEGEIL